MIKKLIKAIIRIVLILSLVIFLIWIYIAQPTFRNNTLSKVSINELRLRNHVGMLSNEFHPRNYKNIDNLNKTAKYIKDHFEHAGGDIKTQEFTVSGKTYKNIIAVFAKGKSNKLIVGAHYDSFHNTPGADDNASGIAGLIEIAYLLGKYDIKREVELVAFSLEEPPFFATSEMGSYIHAKKVSNENISGVIILEMIGYFSDTPWSQSYPLPLLNIIYPNKGNFISIVGKIDQREYTKNFKIGMKGTTDLPVFSINAPASLQGIDFSDHRNYWKHGFNAIMITDTAFYRNKSYHKLNDISDNLYTAT